MAALAKDAYARAALVTMACALAAAVGADTGAFAAFHVQPIWDCMYIVYTSYIYNINILCILYYIYIIYTLYMTYEYIY